MSATNSKMEGLGTFAERRKRMNANELVINTEGLSKAFGEVHALKSFNLRVSQKSIFAILGSNGAGNTTRIKYC